MRLGCLSILALGFFLPLRAKALPERVMSFDIGAGVPQILALQGQVMALTHWQIGFGYGILPGGNSMMPAVKVPAQSVTTSGAGTITITPTLTPTFNTLSPFIRFYPTERNFYIEFAYTMLRLSMNLSSTLTASGSGFDFSGSGISGNVTLLQAMPTISLGHCFQSKLFFFNLSIGASFIASLSSTVTLNSSLPAGLDASTNQAILNGAQDGVNKAAQEAVSTFRKQFLFIPSLMLGIGVLI